MSAIFDSKTLGPTERLVMLALADHADDEGKCYPSILRLCERTGLSERAIQTNVKKLTEAGYLRVSIGGGKGHANLYFVSPNPAADAPYRASKPRSRCTPQEMHPAAGAPQTPQQVRPNPAGYAPEPSGTIIEPSEKNARDALLVMEALTEVVSEETAKAFISHRKAKRAKMTPHAAQLIAGKIRGHPDPDAVVMESIANGWTGVFPKQSKPTGGKHDHRQFDAAIHAVAAGLSEGTIRLRTDDRDPFAQRSGQDAGPSDGGPVALLRPRT